MGARSYVCPGERLSEAANLVISGIVPTGLSQGESMQIQTAGSQHHSKGRRVALLTALAGVLALPALAFAGTTPTEIKAGLGTQNEFVPENPPAKDVAQG